MFRIFLSKCLEYFWNWNFDFLKSKLNLRFFWNRNWNFYFWKWHLIFWNWIFDFLKFKFRFLKFKFHKIEIENSIFRISYKRFFLDPRRSRGFQYRSWIDWVLINKIILCTIKFTKAISLYRWLNENFHIRKFFL